MLISRVETIRFWLHLMGAVLQSLLDSVRKLVSVVTLLVVPVVVVMSDGLFPRLNAAVPEYIKGQYLTEIQLKGARTATDYIGEVADNPMDRFDPHLMMLGHWLPKWRKRYWPNTEEPFVDDVTFSLRPRLYYFHRDTYKKGVEESAAIGGSLGVETGWWNDTIRLGARAYTSQRLYGPIDRDGIGLLAPGQNGYTVLGEAYIDVKYSESLLRAGRTRLDLPFINAWDFRMIPYTFEDVGIRIREWEHLRIGIGHVFRIKTTTSTDFETMSAAAGLPSVTRGVSVISLRYDFNDDDFLALTNQYGWDMMNTLYVEGEMLFEIDDDWSARIGGQWIDQRSVGSALLGRFSTQMLGAKASVQYQNFQASLSYTWTEKGDGFLKPWGATPAYHASMIQDFDRPGEQSVRMGVAYDLEPLGLSGVSIDAGWVYGNTPDRGKYESPDQDEFNSTLNYQPKIDLLEGVWFRVRYANAAMNDGSRIVDLRSDLNYSFTF